VTFKKELERTPFKKALELSEIRERLGTQLRNAGLLERMEDARGIFQIMILLNLTPNPAKQTPTLNFKFKVFLPCIDSHLFHMWQ
jgi:hypothetical protein